MNMEDGYIYAKNFFNELNSSSYDRIVKFTTFGKDFYWKKKMLEKITTEGTVLDLACGTGILSSLLKDSGHSVYGIDLTFDYLRILKSKNLKNFCVNGTAESLPFKNNYFDCIISSYLPKYCDIKKLVNECFRVLKHGGIVILHDFILPRRTLFRTFWNSYFKLLKFSGRFIKNWSKVFDELDSLIMLSKWYDSLPKIFIDKGFIHITSETFTFETAALIFAKKP